jgi:hypothetical protein
MENTRIAQRAQEAGVPLTEAEKEQAFYALDELARSERDPDARRVSCELLEVVRPFFELGWAMGVRTGHTGPAVAGVPVDRATLDRAVVGLVLSGRVAHRFALSLARVLDPQDAGPVLWQKVDYHGSLTQRHGTYWVSAIHAHADPFGEAPELRYDLCQIRGATPVPRVTGVRRVSLTPLPEYRSLR